MLVLATDEIRIDAPVAAVRRQFGDVAHHERTGVHRGIRFAVIDDDGIRCRYRQRTRVGPITSEQVLVLERSADGALVNTIVSGPLAGGAVTFHIDGEGPGPTAVVVTLTAPATRRRRVLAPLLRAPASRSFSAALREDRSDIENGLADPAAVPMGAKPEVRSVGRVGRDA